MRTIKIYAGMTGEFEAIRTNAPDNVIEKQLSLVCEELENSGECENPYSLIEEMGYSVELEDKNSKLEFDVEFDLYDYFEG